MALYWCHEAPSQNDKYFINNLSKSLGELTCIIKFDKIMLMEIST